MNYLIHLCITAIKKVNVETTFYTKTESFKSHVRSKEITTPKHDMLEPLESVYKR